MDIKWTTVLALALMAPAAFGETNPAQPAQPAAQVKTLRQEINRDKNDVSAKTKAERTEHKQLLLQEKAELAKIRDSAGTRSEKRQARLTVREKYAKMMAEARQKSVFERKNLREDMQDKREQIKKLRQS